MAISDCCVDYKLCCCFWVAVSSEMASNSNVLFQKRFAVASFGGWNGELPSCNPLRVVRLSALWHLVGQPSAHWTQPSLTLWPQHADVRASLWTQTSAASAPPGSPWGAPGSPWGNPGGRPGWVDLEALTPHTSRVACCWPAEYTAFHSDTPERLGWLAFHSWSLEGLIEPCQFAR